LHHQPGNSVLPETSPAAFPHSLRRSTAVDFAFGHFSNRASPAAHPAAAFLFHHTHHPVLPPATMAAELRRKLVIVGDGACGKTCLLM
jgi:hypothetical protein